MPIECTTAVASLRNGLYVLGLRMSAFAHSTLLAQPGRSLEAVTVSHWGSPERLLSYDTIRSGRRKCMVAVEGFVP